MTNTQSQSHQRQPGEPVLVVEPQTTHTQTFVLLHGLGSNGEKFGKEFLDTGVTSSGQRLTDLFPGARFVFPTSKRRRSSAFGRSMITQWFDIVKLSDPSHRKERQLQGLAESAQEIIAILEAKFQKVPPQNLIFGGLSQGCAMSLAVLLCLPTAIGGYFGMSGYMTFQADLESAVAEEDIDDDNPFACDETQGSRDPAVEAQTFQRDLLCLSRLANPTREAAATQTPVFLGHGRQDEIVPYTLGEAAMQAMKHSGYSVDWKLYEEQGHWYKIPEEINDIVHFLISRTGLQTAKGGASI